MKWSGDRPYQVKCELMKNPLKKEIVRNDDKEFDFSDKSDIKFIYYYPLSSDIITILSKNY